MLKAKGTYMRAHSLVKGVGDMLHADILTLGFKGGWDMKPYQKPFGIRKICP